MEKLELQEEMYLIKSLYEDLNCYKQGLLEIVLHLDKRVEIIDKFKSIKDDLHIYIKIGEILDNITKNYVDYDSVTNLSGYIIDFNKVYYPKAKREILEAKMLLIELDGQADVNESYINKISRNLTEYKLKSIFKELDIIEQLLISISDKGKMFYDEISGFVDNLAQFNNLLEIDKRNCLNKFCNLNIENNIFIFKLINLYNDYSGVEVIIDINEAEALPMFSRWNSEKLKPILQWNSQLYFKIINTLNNLQQLNEDLLDRSYIKRQIELIKEVQYELNKFT